MLKAGNSAESAHSDLGRALSLFSRQKNVRWLVCFSQTQRLAAKSAKWFTNGDLGEILQNEDFGENKSTFEVNTYECVDLFFHSKSSEYGQRKWPNWLYRK